MTPDFSMDNTPYHSEIDTILRGQSCLGNRALLVFLANLYDLRGGKDWLCSALATLAYRVMVIVSWRTKEQVRRINAAWIVAFMADVHAFGDRAIMQFVAVTMRKQDAPVNMQSSISARQFASLPFPTSARRTLLNFAPEAIISRGTSRVMPTNVEAWLPLDHLAVFTGTRRNRRTLSATAMAIAVWSVARGIIEGHGDLLSRCVKSQAVDAALGHLIAYLHYTPTKQFSQGEVAA